MKTEKIRNHKLGVLVPMYNEGQDTVKPLLDSLMVQQNVNLKDDVGVIICCDGGVTELTDEFMNNYPFDIYFKMCEHKGVSATRNACLDLSKDDYVMFCDCDDMFGSVYGLYIIMREMKIGLFNTLMSAFIEETRDPERNPVYITHEQDLTFVHGKVHNRNYLLKNKIRWNDKLKIHEDSYFNCLCQKLTPEVKYCQQPFYLWRWLDSSVCRHDPKYILRTYNCMLLSNSCLIKEFLKRKRKDDAMFFVVNMVMDAYYILNTKEWLETENQEYRDATEKDFAKYWDDYRYLYDDCPEQAKQQIIVGIKNRFFTQGLFLEEITFNDWIKHIETLEIPEKFSKDIDE